MPEKIKHTRERAPVPKTGEIEVEQITNPETQSESEGAAHTEKTGSFSPLIASDAPSVTPQVHTAEAQRIADIERILEEDLSEIYFKLPVSEQAKFRTTGEQAAREINTLLSSTTVKLKKIIEVITNWLKLIPGVNKFFLQQEAKIKADRLLNLNLHD